MLKERLYELAWKDGDNFRNETIIIQDAFTDKTLYKGKAKDTPDDLLNMHIAKIGCIKHTAVWGVI